MEEISKNMCTCILWREGSILPIIVLFKTFSQRNNKLVWDASMEIVQGLFRDAWAGQDVVTIDHGADLTLPVRYDLLLILYPSSRVAYV